MLVTYVSHKIMEGQVTFPFLLPPPGYRRTSYISPPATTPLVTEGQVTFPLLLPPPWLWKDKLHFSSCYHTTPLIMEGQVKFLLLLPHPPGYGRTRYISSPDATSYA